MFLTWVSRSSHEEHSAQGSYQPGRFLSEVQTDFLFFPHHPVSHLSACQRENQKKWVFIEQSEGL